MPKNGNFNSSKSSVIACNRSSNSSPNASGTSTGTLTTASASKNSESSARKWTYASAAKRWNNSLTTSTLMVAALSVTKSSQCSRMRREEGLIHSLASGSKTRWRSSRRGTSSLTRKTSEGRTQTSSTMVKLKLQTALVKS